MAEIVLIGLNHNTAPVEVRECLAFSQDETDRALEVLCRQPTIEEVVLISTCNRVELLLTCGDRSLAAERAQWFLSDFKKLPHEDFRSMLYIYEGDEAIRHIFRVASSLDSMLVGEPQILGQIKDAYRLAAEKKTTGVILNRLLHKSFFVAKRVRSETGIGDHAVSVSYAAIELARKIFDTLEKKNVLLIGAGEMAEIAVEHLIRNRTGDIFVANRTFERAVDLAARFRGRAIRFDEIESYLELVDIIISSTGATEFILHPPVVKSALKRRRNRPLFFIDIAVPRDIDPKINRLSNAYVYDIDDLRTVIDENIQDRNREAVKAKRIVDEAVIQFRKWMDSLNVVPTIVALRNKFNAIAEVELNKTLQSLNHLSREEREALYRMKDAMVKKILHDPTLFLKSNGNPKIASVYLDITRKLFNLDD
ncbi:MAG: glutamyl-tRNA reductase [Deltaproteobacteria bacterium]|nr:glutamyl-tRNA reductase [Deltaproteobacteria bacterium]MBW1962565.1 glutamyl-tRNA reductase [Deltaproteobacteria bacterium]MBW1994718.1 glutamyl-tRNA reductase [Deltaproteobacteria bacterium]MBW2150135.1 glutamyl-tRNA reductase [Deltaproteobacteria bacterium]